MSQAAKVPNYSELGKLGMAKRWGNERLAKEEQAKLRVRVEQLEHVNQRLIDLMIKGGMDQSVILAVLREVV
jgi:hypothetical protein